VPRRRRWSGGGVSVALVLLAGCGAKRPPQASIWPLDFDHAAAIERLVTLASRPVLLDGTLRFSGRHAGERLRARAIAVIEPNGRFYVESLGQLSFVLACDGDEIRVLLPHERQWLRAPASVATVEALIGLPLRPVELGALISGVGAPADLLRTARLLDRGRLEVTGGHLQLEPAGGSITAGSLRGLEFQLDRPDRRLRLRVPERDLEMTIRWSVLDDEPRDDPALFRPDVPDSFEELELARLRQPVLLPGGGEP